MVGYIQVSMTTRMNWNHASVELFIMISFRKDNLLLRIWKSEMKESIEKSKATVGS